MTTITATVEADFDEWAGLWRGYLTFYGTELPDEITTESFRRIVEGRDLHGAVARDGDGRAIGIVHWLTHPATWSTSPYCYLEDLYVDGESRGSGVGRLLIAHVRDWAVENGCEKVYWLTQETNMTARALYDSVATRTGYTHYQIAL
ncbi:GNAT family N-acetyltransferase [uncultured Microbacterium sp.]|uniref:GNAT family N-acetyltransferase n=1 Tax=uncultured Microbacterium sp. TaxID=191216 RepID=UPI0025E5F6AB|nr:GNAT family N-acetyltransferase [uncultured Microbacterium sp.]